MIGLTMIGPTTWKKGKDHHPQDKIQHLDFTIRSLVRTKLALSKTGRLLSKAEILGVGGLFPSSKQQDPLRACNSVQVISQIGKLLGKTVVEGSVAILASKKGFPDPPKHPKIHAECDHR